MGEIKIPAPEGIKENKKLLISCYKLGGKVKKKTQYIK